MSVSWLVGLSLFCTYVNAFKLYNKIWLVVKRYDEHKRREFEKIRTWKETNKTKKQWQIRQRRQQ